MENVFFKGICQIGIFMICAQTFVHFCPKGAYEKYLKMLVSIMVLIQVISPLGAILGSEGQGLEHIQTGDWLEEVLMQSMDEVLRERRFQLESIEESLTGDGGQRDGHPVVKENELETDAEGVWWSGVQVREVSPEKIEQPSGNIYIEPIAPIRVGR